jgi:hypothetical protein
LGTQWQGYLPYSIVENFGRVISRYIFPLTHMFENYLTPNFNYMYGMYVYACDIAYGGCVEYT